MAVKGAEAGEQFRRGAHERVAPLEAIVVGEIGRDAPAKNGLLFLLGRERAHDAVVGDAFVEKADHPGPVAPVAAALKTHAPAMPEIIHHKERDENESSEGELPVEKKEQDKDAEPHGEIADQRDRSAGDEHVHGAGVLRDAGHDAAGLAFLVKFERELLEMREDGDAQGRR